VKIDRILDHDLFLCDTQPGSFGGANDEFLRSGRLDDLQMCHAGVEALIAGAGKGVKATRMAICYDSEEVGSLTSQGARSNLVPAVLERICLALGDDREGYLASLAASRLVSADNTHALHPGYAETAEPSHAPILNGGPTIKIHANRAYATDAETASFFELACRKAGVPSQRFVNRSDSRSGGTIGSMAAAQLGVRTVDVGNPQYAMHSVRETGGTNDHDAMIEALGAFYVM
jgi:aspartyl aminopeptidase